MREWGLINQNVEVYHVFSQFLGVYESMYVYIYFCLQTVLGKVVQRPAKLDKRLARELKGLADPEDPYDTITGKTMCTYDFYEGK